MDDKEYPPFPTGLASGENNADGLNYYVWGAVVTITPSFRYVIINVEPEIQRVFIKVKLRWYARINWLFFRNFMEWQRERWRSLAQRAVEKHIPMGYKVLVYYDNNIEEGVLV